MTDLSDILSCDQLDAAAKQQERHVGKLGWEVARLNAHANAAQRSVDRAVEQYNEFNDKIKGEISEAKQILANTPKTVPGATKQMDAKNPDWQKAKDDLDRLTQRQQNVLKVLQNQIDIERENARLAKEKLEEKEAELAKARQYLQQLNDAAARCRNKPKSRLVGSVMVGLGVGFALLGGVLLHGGTKTPTPVSIDEQHAVAAPAPAPQPSSGTALTVVTVPRATSQPVPEHHSTGSTRKSIANEPLGENAPTATTVPERATRVEDDHATVETGDSHATGDEASNTGGNTAVGNDGGSAEPGGNGDYAGSHYCDSNPCPDR